MPSRNLDDAVGDEIQAIGDKLAKELTMKLGLPEGVEVLYEQSRYVTSTADTSPEPARSDAEPHSIAPGAIWPGSEPRYRLMRLCECEACEGRGKLRIAQGEYARCPDCRGEGKTLDEVARCDTPAAIGTALVTLAQEGEFEGCPFGLIDDQGETGHKWLIRPWQASPRNVSDAARTLAKSKGDK